MNQDEQNLNLLAIFHYILGGLTVLFSCIFLFYVGIGIAMLAGAFDAHDQPPRAFGLIFLFLGLILLLSGWALGICMIAAGKRLKMHRSRMFCLVVAGLECMITPFGTVLGVFTIVVLMKESVIQLFNGNQAETAGQ